MSTKARIPVGIIGASGYTGADLVRLLAMHQHAEIRVVTANSHAGKTMAEVFPHLGGLSLPKLIETDAADWASVEAVFCCLPHGTSQEVIAALPSNIKIIDLSADFRLRNAVTYKDWYGHEHRALHLQSSAVYGLTEFHREEISSARLVACPGCYPTAALLALLPLIYGRAVDPDDVIIDAKSGATGAGRSLKEETLFCEVAEGIHPYGIARHRHAPEIEQEMSVAANKEVVVNFTPHLMPMNRGELLTIYARLAPSMSVEDARGLLVDRYADEQFVRVVDPGVVPSTRHIRGSNYCLIGIFADRVPGRIIIVSVLDNLDKWSSGQAIQNFNLMFGLEEKIGLEQQPLFP